MTMNYRSTKPSTVLWHLLGIKPSTRVIGYIGSLREMEGVDLTAEADIRTDEAKGFDVRFFVLSRTAGQKNYEICVID